MIVKRRHVYSALRFFLDVQRKTLALVWRVVIIIRAMVIMKRAHMAPGRRMAEPYGPKCEIDPPPRGARREKRVRAPKARETATPFSRGTPCHDCALMRPRPIRAPFPSPSGKPAGFLACRLPPFAAEEKRAPCAFFVAVAA